MYKKEGLYILSFMFHDFDLLMFEVKPLLELRCLYVCGVGGVPFVYYLQGVIPFTYYCVNSISVIKPVYGPRRFL